VSHSQAELGSSRLWNASLRAEEVTAPPSDAMAAATAVSAVFFRSCCASTPSSCGPRPHSQPTVRPHGEHRAWRPRVELLLAMWRCRCLSARSNTPAAIPVKTSRAYPQVDLMPQVPANRMLYSGVTAAPLLRDDCTMPSCWYAGVALCLAASTPPLLITASLPAIISWQAAETPARLLTTCFLAGDR
jgi:hypothetical protein